MYPLLFTLFTKRINILIYINRYNDFYILKRTSVRLKKVKEV